MTIDIKTVDHLAKLSRLRFSDDEKQTFLQELNTIIDFVSQLSEVNTDGVEPMAGTQVAASSPERQDTVTATDQREANMANAPKSEMGFFVVPKVIE